MEVGKKHVMKGTNVGMFFLLGKTPKIRGTVVPLYVARSWSLQVFAHVPGRGMQGQTDHVILMMEVFGMKGSGV